MGILDRLFGKKSKVKKKSKQMTTKKITKKKSIKPNVKILKEKRDVEGLIETLKDNHSPVREREEAARALGEIGEPAVKPLIEALEDENLLVQEWAIKALGKIGDAKAVKPLIESISRTQHIRFRPVVQLDILLVKAVEALVKIGEPAVKPLIKALKDEFVRAEAAQALGKIGDARAVKPLIQALKVDDGLARGDIERALKKIKAKKS